MSINKLFLEWPQEMSLYSPLVTQLLIQRAVSQYAIVKINIKQENKIKLNLNIFKYTFPNNIELLKW